MRAAHKDFVLIVLFSPKRSLRRGDASPVPVVKSHKTGILSTMKCSVKFLQCFLAVNLEPSLTFSP